MVNYVTKKRETKHERGGLCLDEDEARYHFTQLLSAVDYCHKHQVAHRCVGGTAPSGAPVRGWDSIKWCTGAWVGQHQVVHRCVGGTASSGVPVHGWDSTKWCTGAWVGQHQVVHRCVSGTAPSGAPVREWDSIKWCTGA